MILVSVYDVCSDLVLYRLLEERPERANISHREMPSWSEHKTFIESHPYHAWYLIMDNERSLEVFGAIYLTRDNEIGVSLFEKHMGKGHAARAIRDLMDIHPRKRYFANINPKNDTSIEFFEKLGFTHIQNTYQLNV